MMNFLVSLDHHLFFLINNHGTKWLDSIFEDLTWLGGWTIAIVALAFLAPAGKKVFWRHVLVLLLAVACFGSINSALKKTVKRARPLKAFQEQIEEGTVEVRVVGKSLKRKSFPSGHSFAAFIFMTYIAFYKKKYSLWVLILAALIAFSRVYVGAHFPLDCLAGSMIGALGAWAGWSAYQFADRKFWSKTSAKAMADK
jgi:undecaprenyl-diphosphatase